MIKTYVVFNEGNDGYKYSVRSCIKEVKPSELVGYLAEGIGSGGGHYEKAGGFISMKLYEEKYPTFHADAGGGFGADCGKGCEGVYPVG